MQRHLLGISSAILVAIAVHAAYILFAPGYRFSKSLETLVSGSSENDFFVVQGSEQSRFFPGYPAASVVGACLFDVSKSSVSLSARLPFDRWVLTIYSIKGEVIYSLNETQAGTTEFSVSLALAPSLIEMLMQPPDREAPDNTGWSVESYTDRGLAVIWIPVREPALRQKAIEGLKATLCKASA